MSLVETKITKRVEIAYFPFDREPYISRTPIDGLLLIRRPQYRDDRGAFQENARIPDISKILGREVKIQQSQRSRSRPGVLRGIHTEPQDKLITPQTGRMVAVIVDLNPKSLTFLKWLSIEFDNTNPELPKTSMFLSEGLGNSICVIGDEPVEYSYSVSKTYDPTTSGRGVRFDDPQLNIPWPGGEHIISDRDRNLPSLQEFLQQYYG